MRLPFLCGGHINALPPLNALPPSVTAHEKKTLYSRLVDLFKGVQALLQPCICLPNPTAKKVPSSTAAQVATACLGTLSSSRALPIDPNVIIRKLDNGLTYYIRPHAYPFPNKAYLRVAVRAGNVSESKEESGIAHLVEHIAQTETSSFAKGQIKTYLDSKGIRWAGDNTAHTGDRETLYYLDIPLDDPELLDKSFQILSETVSAAQLSDETIEAEREIVIDELRQRQHTLGFRFHRQVRSLLLEGTPYPQLLDSDHEIENVRTCPPEIIRQFYTREYRPENMSVIAVGDFDPNRIENLIKKYFNKIPPSQHPGAKFEHTPTAHPEARFLCFTDPDASATAVAIHYKPFLDKPGDTLEIADVKFSLVSKLFKYMLNARLEELTEQIPAPFLEATSSTTHLLPNYSRFAIGALACEGKLLEAYRQLLLELKRAKTHGFQPSEFERAKTEISSELEHALREKNKISSKTLVNQYKDHFIDSTPLPDPIQHAETRAEILSELTCADINAYLEKLDLENHCVVTTFSPEKAGLTPIVEADLQKIMEEVKQAEVTPYKDSNVNRPLMTALPPSGTIVETRLHEKSQVTEYTLENGLKVYVKPTSFENDNVTIYGYAIRGCRDADPAHLPSANFATDFFDRCGLGDFDAFSLKKSLAGKNVSLSVNVGNYITSFKTSSVKKDLETSFQICHLLFANPGYNQDAFHKALTAAEETLRNQYLDPYTVFSHETIRLNTQDHPHFKPMNLEDLKLIDYETTKKFHQDSFANPANFNIVIVGNISQDSLKLLIERYMASLPKQGERRTTFAYSPVPFPQGIVRKVVRAGLQPACISLLSFPTPASDTYYNRLLSEWCCEIVNNRLLEVLRMQMNKTYSPACFFAENSISHLNPEHPSRTIIYVSCEPEYLEQVEKALVEEIRRLQIEGPSEQDIADLKAAEKMARQQTLKTNEGWLDTIVSHTLFQQAPDRFDDFNQALEALSISSVKEKLRQLFPLDNYTMVTLHPKEACGNSSESVSP